MVTGISPQEASERLNTFQVTRKDHLLKAVSTVAHFLSALPRELAIHLSTVFVPIVTFFFRLASMNFGVSTSLTRAGNNCLVCL